MIVFLMDYSCGNIHVLNIPDDLNNDEVEYFVENFIEEEGLNTVEWMQISNEKGNIPITFHEFKSKDDDFIKNTISINISF